MLKRNYLVAEDNDGGLWLFIIDSRDIAIHVYNGFEHEVGSLVNALHELGDRVDACELWENDIVELHGVDAWYYCRENDMDIINHNGVVYPESMGRSALEEFAICTKIYCTKLYLSRIDVYMTCSSVKFAGSKDAIFVYIGDELIARIGVENNDTFTLVRDGGVTSYRIEAGVCYEIF